MRTTAPYTKDIELIGHVDDQHRLHVEVPADFPPGPVKVLLSPVGEEDAEGDWSALINAAWARDWSDPREDIYTLEDGQPECQPR